MFVMRRILGKNVIQNYVDYAKMNVILGIIILIVVALLDKTHNNTSLEYLIVTLYSSLEICMLNLNYCTNYKVIFINLIIMV